MPPTTASEVADYADPGVTLEYVSGRDGFEVAIATLDFDLAKCTVEAFLARQGPELGRDLQSAGHVPRPIPVQVVVRPVRWFDLVAGLGGGKGATVVEAARDEDPPVVEQRRGEGNAPGGLRAGRVKVPLAGS
jgi:hypothetical protein